MRKHDLIAILRGEHQLDDMPGIIAVPADGFTAVCAAAHAPLMRLAQDRASALRAAAARQAICETLMTRATVLPALPQQAIPLDQINTMITANQDSLLDWTAGFADLAQFQITVTWDRTHVLPRFRDAPEIAPLFAKQRVAASQIERAVHDLSQRLSVHITMALGLIAKDMIALPDTSDCLANVVVLIKIADAPNLDRCLEQIDAIWTEGLRIRQIGPGPAGSFLSLRTQRVTPQHLAAARQLFGDPVPDIGTRRKALLRQPDQFNPDDVRRAARTLLAAARLPKPESGFIILAPWSEGQSDATDQTLQVA